MLDHIFLPVSDIACSVAFYRAALAPLGVSKVFDDDGRGGPSGRG